MARHRVLCLVFLMLVVLPLTTIVGMDHKRRRSGRS